MRIWHLAKLIILVSIFSTFGMGQENTDSAKNKQVLLNISVVDSFNEPINDLKVENFRLFENKKPIKISDFNSENSPISVGFLIDSSRSMENNIDTSREAILTLLEESNPENEYFVTAFGKQINTLSEFNNADETTKVVSASPYFTKSQKKGETVVYDAIIEGIEKFSKAKNSKKVLFVFWDTSEYYNSGRYKEIEKLIREKNIILYPTGFNKVPLEKPLEELAEISGGTAIYLDTHWYPLGDQQVIFYRSKYYSERQFFMLKYSKIARQLKSLYTIGFKPDLEGDKNKWRKLEIKLETEKELRKKNGSTEAFYRKGYYPFSEVVTSN